MALHLGNVPANTVIPIPFATYDANGASVTMTGFATSDILIYKNGSVTQRSSVAGFTLLDGDGTDFDGVTGLHGFSIDLSDNTDAGFYTVGAFFWVVLSTITVNAQTVTGLIATFRIVPAENTTGYPLVDGARIAGIAQTGRDMGLSVLLSAGAGTGQLDFTAGVVKANPVQWNGTAVATPDTAGYPKVTNKTGTGAGELSLATGVIQADVAKMNGVAATAITTVNANQGTTQPVNFTGTAGAALVKGDAVDIAGAAVAPGSAQLGVNVVNFGGAAGTFAAGRPEVNTTHAAGTAWNSGAIGAATLGANAITAAKIATDAIGAAQLAADAVDEILDDPIIGSTTLRQLMRLYAAALGGKADGLGTTTVHYRNLPDTRNVITSTVDASGNRTAVTLDLADP